MVIEHTATFSYSKICEIVAALTSVADAIEVITKRAIDKAGLETPKQRLGLKLVRVREAVQAEAMHSVARHFEEQAPDTEGIREARKQVESYIEGICKYLF